MEFFTLTPLEAAYWALGVSVQTALATKMTGNVLFTAIAVTFFGWRFYRQLSSVGKGVPIVEVRQNVFEQAIYLVIGLVLLRTISPVPFSPKDYSGKQWTSYSGVRQNQEYQALQNASGGLTWYLRAVGAARGLSSYATKIINKMVNDNTYGGSSNLAFRMLVASANVQIDDPNISSKIDALVQQCSDRKIIDANGRDANFESLLDLSKPECEGRYRVVKSEMKNWAQRKMPEYIRKTLRENPEDMPLPARELADEELMENKLIASAMVMYGRNRAKDAVDSQNNNLSALRIDHGTSEHFWYTLQKALTTGGFVTGFASLFGKGQDVDDALVLNEAGQIYHQFYKMLPVAKGLLHIFLAISFLVTSFALSCGQTGGVIWWLRTVLLTSLFEPLSVLNYHICTLMMRSSEEYGHALGSLANDPMALAGAAAIDHRLAQVKTGYYLAEMALISATVLSVLGGGWVFNKLGFAQGATVSGAVRSFANSPIVRRATGGAFRRLGQRG